MTDLAFASYNHVETEWGQQLNFSPTRQLKLYTHRLYGRYPARSVFLVPRAILSNFKASQRQSYPVRVLDPFMGSGTSAVEAVLQGMVPFGVELDPFARLLAETKVTRFSRKELTIIDRSFAEIMATWQTHQIQPALRPQLNNIEYWFDPHTFDNLLRLKSAIYDICAAHPTILNFFRILLADMIRPCSKAERQTLKPYISKRFPKTPAPVEDTFKHLYGGHRRGIQEFTDDHRYRKAIRWLGDDAVNFQSDADIDIAVTSPPYINALDYVRCIRLESAWIGCGNTHSFAVLRDRHVGEALRPETPAHDAVMNISEPYISQIAPLDPKRAKLVLHYFHDMYANLTCTWNALKPGGEYHLIVGDSVVRGVEIPTHQLLAELGQQIGFRWMRYYQYPIKDHRTSIPRNGQGGKIEIEHVITLRKEF